MEENDTGSYFKQAIGILLIYIAVMFIYINFNPSSATMTCDENYYCRVENKYIWNLKRTDDFYVNDSAKLRFYGTRQRRSGFVNIYGNNLNWDPFGTKNFYSFKSEHYKERESIMNADIKRFDDYIANPKQTFVMSTKYSKLLSFLITLFFIGFALTQRPIDNLQKFLGILLRVIFFRWFW